jgi:Helix-turn-helix DNA-binding domain of SPT6
MSSKSSRKRSNVDDDDDDDGVFDDADDDDDDDGDDDVDNKPATAKKRKTKSFIDDAAEESGDEGGNDDDEDEDDDDENNDYIKDGFVVDEEEDDDDAIPKKKDDLEDSDEESDDEERDDSRLQKVRKMRTTDRLDDDDLALIKEAQGGAMDDDDEMPDPPEIEIEKPRERVVATTEAELRRGLFHDSGDEDDDRIDDAKAPSSDRQKALKTAQSQAIRKPHRVEQYDEDGMDDFIEDDIGDQEIIRMSDRKGGIYDDGAQQEISEAQLHEASEIFGTDYLEFMQDEKDENAEIYDDEEELLGRSKFRERGVGVQYGVESDEEDILSDDDDDDDLFGDDDDDGVEGGSSSQQKAEALRLKREKRTLAKAERRRQVQLKKSERRKAQLRRAFEPVQLVENFCTERDDEIRQRDIPERMFDWKAQFNGSDQDDSLNAVEEEQARWIARRIPAVAAELALAGGSQEKERTVYLSIANALRFMHRDKLEPAFIKRYRRDYVVSVAVQDNLETVMDENGEFDRVLEARVKVEGLLDYISKSASSDDSVSADAQKLIALQEELADAQKKLDETAKQESQVKAELTALSGGDDDDDDKLFGDDDDDDDDENDEVRNVSLWLNFLREKASLISYESINLSGQKERENTSRIAPFNNPIVIRSSG